MIEINELIMDDIPSDEIITSITRREYYKLEDIIKEFPNENYARIGWENLLRQEYIKQQMIDSVNTGLVKHFRVTFPSYFKIVEHTFIPTEDDLNSNDWYII